MIKGFRHKSGNHCESTTMVDLIVHEGIDITEAMVFGLDSTFGFTFFDNSQSPTVKAEFGMGSPLFIGGKQGSITAKSMACRILGLNITFETFSSADVAWESSKTWIAQDIPVGLKVDLGYLPYLDVEENFHFGGHYITLAGYDEEKNLAFVYDTELKEVQEIAIDALKKARSSQHGPRFLRPHNAQITIVKRPDGKKPPFPKAVKLALQQVARQFLAPSMNYHGTPALQLFAKSIPRWPDILAGDMKDPYTGNRVLKAATTLEMVYGLIEEWGTGGAIFRNLYADFLKELVKHPELNTGPHTWKEDELFYLTDAGDHLVQSARLWSQFSSHINQALQENKQLCLEYLDYSKLEQFIEEIIVLEETCFDNLLQIKL